MPDTARQCSEAIGSALIAATIFVIEIKKHASEESGIAALTRLMEAQLRLQEALFVLVQAEREYLEEYEALQSDASASWN